MSREKDLYPIRETRHIKEKEVEIQFSNYKKYAEDKNVTHGTTLDGFIDNKGKEHSVYLYSVEGHIYKEVVPGIHVMTDVSESRAGSASYVNTEIFVRIQFNACPVILLLQDLDKYEAQWGDKHVIENNGYYSIVIKSEI